MEDIEMNGLDQELGFQKQESGQIVQIEKKKKRKMFYEWEVGERKYPMKLTTNIICTLESKYRKNLLNVITGEGIPPLDQMLTIAQGAMSPWNHGITFSEVKRIFDEYVSEGGNQIDFYRNVIMGVMSVSGFFTESQAKELTEKIETAGTMI